MRLYTRPHASMASKAACALSTAPWALRTLVATSATFFPGPGIAGSRHGNSAILFQPWTQSTKGWFFFWDVWGIVWSQCDAQIYGVFIATSRNPLLGCPEEFWLHFDPQGPSSSQKAWSAAFYASDKVWQGQGLIQSGLMTCLCLGLAPHKFCYKLQSDLQLNDTSSTIASPVEPRPPHLRIAWTCTSKRMLAVRCGCSDTIRHKVSGHKIL